MKRIFFYSLSILLLHVSCKKQNNTTKELIYEELKIEVDYPFLPYYDNVSLMEKDDIVYLGGYNSRIHSFDFISLSERELSSNISVKLQKEGPEQIGSVSPFSFSDESILLNDIKSIKVISFQGKVIRNMDVDSLFKSLGVENFSRKPLGVNPGGYQKVEYIATTNSFILPIIPSTDKDDISNYSIGINIDINNDNSALFPSKFPSDLNENFKSYGGLIIPYINSFSDRIVYNFPYSSNIYVWDKESNSTSIINMASKTIDDKAPPMEKEMRAKEKFEYEYKVQRFRDVHYSSSLKKYFRIHHSPKQKIFNDVPSRSYLMIYNIKNNSQKEYILPDNASSQYIFSDDILYVLCDEINEENEMRIFKIDLAKINDK